MTTEIALKPQMSPDLEAVLINGDLKSLPSDVRLNYYRAVCESVGLNPLTKPCEYIELNGKLTLYAKKDATDQIRKNYAVSLTIVSREVIDEIYVVTARASDANGRTDESTGAVALPRGGTDRANAMMKAETKAKRRVTLSFCGLGVLDESEIDSVPEAKRVTVDTETGEIVTQILADPLPPTAASD